MDRMTIDEVARAAGTTTRNVRAYQERGLLPRPQRIGRVGYYDASHLQRLELISRLLARGFTLSSIGQLVDAFEQGDELADVLGLDEALSQPYIDERPRDIDLDELAARLPTRDPAAVERMVDATLLEPTEDGYRSHVPGIFELAEHLAEAGIPVDDLLDEAERLRADTDRIAERFLDLFMDHIWQPFLDAGAPRERIPQVRRAIELTHPVPSKAIALLVGDAMRRRMDVVRAQMAEAAADGVPAGTVRLGADTEHDQPEAATSRAQG